MKKDNGFLQGYSCAVATLLFMEGCASTPITELYEAGIGKNETEKTLKAKGVDQYDIDKFKEHGLLK